MYGKERVMNGGMVVLPESLRLFPADTTAVGMLA